MDREEELQALMYRIREKMKYSLAKPVFHNEKIIEELNIYINCLNIYYEEYKQIKK